jgi:hypothetical protein
MHIPRYWSLSRQTPTSNGRLNLQTWGWSDANELDAAQVAERRLQRLMARARTPSDLLRSWQYYDGQGERPLREEIVNAAPGGLAATEAIVTRNRYGVEIINAARLLFIDVDLPPTKRRGFFDWLRGRPAAEADAERLARLQRDLAGLDGLFHVYRTAAGFRVLAADRSYDPTAAQTQALLQRVGADPLFARLCAAQASFRARLGPKPWRCGMTSLNVQFPHAAAEQARVAHWLAEYRRRADAYATSRWVGQIGSSTPLADLEPLIKFHDQATRARTDLPLA